MMEPCEYYKMMNLPRLIAKYVFLLWMVNLMSVAVADETADFIARLNEIEQKRRLLPSSSNNLDLAYAIFNQSCDTPEPAIYQAQSLRAKAEQYESDWGVELRGRITSESLNSGDDDDGARGYLELSWDVLKSGYISNRDKAKTLLKQAELMELQEQTEQLIRRQRCIRYHLDKSFVAYTANSLALKLALMEAVYPYERRAYINGVTRFDDLAVSDSELKMARHELNYLHSSGFFDEAMSTIQNPPAIDLDMEKLVAAIRENSTLQQGTEIRKEIVRHQKLAAEDRQLRFFVRDNILQEDSFEPENVVVGLNFRMPLRRDSERDVTYQVKALDAEQRMQVWERLLKVRDAYRQVRFKQKQLIRQYARWLRAAERVRQTLAEIRLGNHTLTPVAATRLRTVLDADYELIQLKQALYQNINSVLMAAGIAVQPGFFRLFEMEFAKNKARAGKRGLWLKADAFAAFDHIQLIDFFEAKGISQIFMPIGASLDKTKFKQFVQLARQNHYQVTPVIGANDWAKPENHPQAVNQALIWAELNGTLHLTIFPQALASAKPQQDAYFKQYLQLLRKIRLQLKAGKISVSVAEDWPEAAYQKIAEIVDHMILPVKGDVQPEILKILEQAPKEKWILQLDLKGLPDYWAIEKRIDHWHQATLLEQFSLDGFQQMLDLAGKH